MSTTIKKSNPLSFRGVPSSSSSSQPFAKRTRADRELDKKNKFINRERNSGNGPVQPDAGGGSGRRRRQKEALGMFVDLDRLRSEIRRFPDMYVEEFCEKLRHFEAQLNMLTLNPGKDSKELCQLIGFICAVASCFPKQSGEVPGKIMAILEQQSEALEPATRTALCKGLILLRGRKMLTPSQLLPLFFKLFRCRDKALRELLYNHIVTDIVTLNKGARGASPQLNRELQNFMYTMLQDSNESAAKKSLDVMITLFRRQVWNDAKTADVIATACFRDSPRLLLAALKFFLSSDQPDDSDDEDDSDADSADDEVARGVLSNGPLALGIEAQRIHERTLHARKTSKRVTRAKRELKAAKKKARRQAAETHVKTSAVFLLNDAQGFAERLFALLKKPTMRFEVRMMVMSLVSRLIAVHQLVLINFYPFIQRYLRPHQEHITHILALLAQACHEFIDPETLQPLVRTLADSFITDRSSPEAQAAGINTIREMCQRCPYVMDESLLRDLAQYKRDRSKAVAFAAKSLVHLFRVLNPALLHKKDRGRDAQVDLKAGDVQPLEFGIYETTTRVPGAELLQRYLDAKARGDSLEEFESASDDDDDDDDDDIDDDEDEDDIDDDEDEIPQLESNDDDDLQTLEDENGSSDEELEIQSDEGEDDDDDDQDDDDNDEEDKTDDAPALASSSTTTTTTPLEATKIFSEEDFRLIRKLRAHQELVKRGVVKTIGDRVTSNTIEGPIHAHVRMTAEQRLDHVKKGREGRTGFGSKKAWHERTSLTNEEKKKNKPFVLAKQQSSIRGKVFRDITTKKELVKKHARKSKAKKKR